MRRFSSVLQRMEKLLLPRLIPGPFSLRGEGSTALIERTLFPVFPWLPLSSIGREVDPQSRSEAA
jgi:hypothetical protein